MLTKLIDAGETTAEKVKRYRDELHQISDKSRRFFNANTREWREEYYMPSGTVVTYFPRESYATFITTNPMGRTERVITYKL